MWWFFGEIAHQSVRAIGQPDKLICAIVIAGLGDWDPGAVENPHLHASFDVERVFECQIDIHFLTVQSS